MRQRGTFPKVFFKLSRSWGNIPEVEVLALLKTGIRCDMCGGKIKEVGYIRVGREIELALCKNCLIDYVEALGDLSRRR
ncbi:MAG: hypothetical protein ACK4M3_07110 [Pyrobaculum sp.]